MKLPQESKVEERFDADAVRDHYDRLSIFYRALWGEHIHHGFWENGETPATAQVKLVERLAARAGVPRNAHVLDVGCGLGGSAFWLARNLGCSVLGLNNSSVQVAIAAKKACAEKLEERVRFKLFDANLLESLDANFDVVWVIEASEHLIDKAGFIRNCARLLKPSGTLALCAWLKADRLASASQARLITDICQAMLCPHLASVRDYTDWMRAVGFIQIESEEITPHVKETWMRCEAIVRRTEIRALLCATDERTRRFVESFALMRKAYDEGAMAYGMFKARKV